jgi:CRP/FNR family transcriptional regulator, cyclic AMP receptor protein
MGAIRSFPARNLPSLDLPAMPATPPKIPAVTALPEDTLQALFGYAGVTDFPKNTIIINEGERTDSVYLIRSGRVKVFLRGEDGKKVDINMLEPGDFFGEMALDHGLRSASVMTVGPAQLSIIPQSVFSKFVIGNPDFAMRVILKLILRARGLLKNVKSLALLDVYGRVARTLLELATRDNDRLVIREKLSAQDIAHRIGTSRESVSRILRDLIERGYILMDGKSMTITRPLPPRL